MFSAKLRNKGRPRSRKTSGLVFTQANLRVISKRVLRWQGFGLGDIEPRTRPSIPAQKGQQGIGAQQGPPGHIDDECIRSHTCECFGSDSIPSSEGVSGAHRIKTFAPSSPSIRDRWDTSGAPEPLVTTRSCHPKARSSAARARPTRPCPTMQSWFPSSSGAGPSSATTRPNERPTERIAATQEGRPLDPRAFDHVIDSGPGHLQQLQRGTTPKVERARAQPIGHRICDFAPTAKVSCTNATPVRRKPELSPNSGLAGAHTHTSLIRDIISPKPVQSKPTIYWLRGLGASGALAFDRDAPEYPLYRLLLDSGF